MFKGPKIQSSIIQAVEFVNKQLILPLDAQGSTASVQIKNYNY